MSPHLDGVDFAGKTGTADVVGGRAKNSTNKSTIPNAWFVGMTPRRNPDIVVAVLWEHGYWGNNSAKLAAQVIDAFVNKQRKQANNIRIADTPPPDSRSRSPPRQLSQSQRTFRRVRFHRTITKDRTDERLFRADPFWSVIACWRKK